MTNVEIMIVLVVIFVLLIGLATAVIMKEICELAVDLLTSNGHLMDVLESVSKGSDATNEKVESVSKRIDLINDRIDLNDETVKQLIDIFNKMTKELSSPK